MGYSKDIYRKAWQVLDQRKETAQASYLRNREEVQSQVPEIEKIHREMQGSGATLFKVALSSPNAVDKQINELKEVSLLLQNRRDELLNIHGYPKDFLSYKYHCNLCNDSGYIGSEMCSCFKQLLKETAYAQLSGGMDNSGDGGFSEFSLDYYSPNASGETGVSPRERMSDILGYAKHYARSFGPNSPSLLMIGKTGLGKTHISKAIAKSIIDKGFGVIYTPIQRLIDRLETKKFSYKSEDKEEYTQILNSVISCDLLILDDLGTEYTNSFTTSIVYNIINSRLSENRPSIVNTNLELSGIESVYSQRMASRLGFEYKILQFLGSDIRMLKRRNQMRNIE